MAEKIIMTNVIKVWTNILWRLLIKHYEDIPSDLNRYDGANTGQLFVPYYERDIVEIEGKKYLQVKYQSGPFIVQWEEEMESTLSAEEKAQIRAEDV